LVTPFNEKGGIDWPTLHQLIERALPFCDGLFIGEGLVGEGLSLPNPVRLELLQGSWEAVSGRKPLLLCPTASTTEETLGNVEAGGRLNYNNRGNEFLFWVDLPLWYHSNRKLPQLYQEWTDRTPFPILLYNHPYLISKLNRTLKRRNIRTAVLKRLSENEQIVGLIQAGNLIRTIHYHRAVRARHDFRFYDGDEKSFLNQPSSSGVVSWGANLLPEEWSEIVSSSLGLSEDPARSLTLLKQSQRLRQLSQALRPNPAKTLKFALHRLGIIPMAKVLDETFATSTRDDLEITNFLRENFPLQPTP
jgi:dihydrodipicolinate synthase/N-acetylneuraminate lyase